YAASEVCATAELSRRTIVICENGFSTRTPRPRARACMRFITRFFPTWASATTRLSMSRPWLLSALATADFSSLSTSPAARLRENSSSAIALSTFRPRICCASRLSFCGLMRCMRSTARDSLEACFGGAFCLPILFPRHSLVAAVAVEGARRRELAELVAHHLLGNRNRHEGLAVVYLEGETDELRQDGRAARPGLDWRRTRGARRGFRLLQQIAIDERAFPDGAGHSATLRYAFLCRRRTISRSVDLFLRVLGPRVFLPHGVTG